jgi:hypothetical protein
MSFTIPVMTRKIDMAEIQAPPEVMRGCDTNHEYGFS